ncbi:DUF2497 domain-containing protein [Hyphobacterium indicum]|uniref:DUF2497 domain-containing protein n=1 Tax=Hyphobacterium indicum TaxID=2162714 RepID=UPI000D6489B6|nr:DUF2497 domain-containing protein [Hyphobacterium indicum]
MPTEAAENEPSMEEILASIRRIIDEDEDGGEAEAAAESPAADEPAEEATPEPAPEPAAEAPSEPEPVAEAPAEPEPADDEVLELTDKIDEVGGGTDPLALDDDLMIVDREEDEPAPQPEPEPVAEAAPEAAPQPAAEEDDSLVGAPAATAAAGAFDALAENLRVASADGLTLEGIVREMMRPMLKDWLDTNLPRIVEEKVEAEIERISRRR